MSDNGNEASGHPSDLAFVRDPDAARSLLDPLRRTILERLGEPGSSTSVAQALGLPRQRVNYHVRELEGNGFLRHVEDRRRGNCLERVLQATARRYVVDPGVLGTLTPTESPSGGKADAFSSTVLLGSAARTVAHVGALHAETANTGRRVPALCLEAQLRFRTPREAVEFAEIIERVFRRLVSRYDQPEAGGPGFRVTLHGHPESDRAARTDPNEVTSNAPQTPR